MWLKEHPAWKRVYFPCRMFFLIDAKKLAEKNCLHSDLQVVLGMLKYRKEKEKLLEYTNAHKDYFKHLDNDTYVAVCALLGSRKQLKQYRNKEEEIDMCKALDDLYQDGVKQGVEQGIEQGITQGITQGEVRYSNLILKLSELGLSDLIVQVASNSDYREELYQKYSI